MNCPSLTASPTSFIVPAFVPLKSDSKVIIKDKQRIEGFLPCENKCVRWFSSLYQTGLKSFTFSAFHSKIFCSSDEGYCQMWPVRTEEAPVVNQEFFHFMHRSCIRQPNIFRRLNRTLVIRNEIDLAESIGGKLLDVSFVIPILDLWS